MGNDESIQLIFCIETNKKAKTDEIYISETISQFYKPLGNHIKRTYIYMNSKTKYKSKEVINEIKKKKKDFKDTGESFVIYCVDTDKFETDQRQRDEFNEINDYCKSNNYELIWFCHDVEEVYLGTSITPKLKKNSAVKFMAHGDISKVKFEN